MKKTTTLTLILAIILGSVTIGQRYTKLSDFPEHMKGTKPFKRFAWEFQQRAFPHDTLPIIYARSMYNEEMDKIAKESAYTDKMINWYSKGPAGVEATGTAGFWGTVSGRVKAVAVHPTDPLTVYIGAATGGLWKTTDGGDSWNDIGKDLESLNFGAIAIDPNNPDIIYAGSGEAWYESPLVNYSGRGLFKSTDAGESWQVITNGFGQYTHFAKISINPQNSDILFAALSEACYYFGYYIGNEGIWKSTDGGETWSIVLDQLAACDVKFHPADPEILYASIGGQHGGSGFYISTDQGETWTISNNGIPQPDAIERILFDISLTDNDIVYAVAYEPLGCNLWGYTYTNAYKSTDGGENWQPISENIHLGGLYNNSWYDQGMYDLCIAVDPSNSDHVFIGNVELHETVDGELFSPVRPYYSGSLTGSIAHVDYHQVVFSQSDPNYLYIGCDGGVYQSTDAGLTAESKNVGLETYQFYRIGSHPFNPDSIIGGLQDNGTVLTGDGGETWKMVMTGDGMECFFDHTNPNIIYASHQNGYFKRSVNGGNSFAYLANLQGTWIAPYFMHPLSNDTLFMADYDVFRWHGWLMQTTSDLLQVNIEAMAQSNVNPMHMILAGFHEWTAGVNMGNDTIPVMISTDGGYSWTDVTSHIPGEKRWIPRVITHPTDENTMFILRTGYSEENKILKTTDLGQTWENVSGDLPDIPCNDLFIDPVNTSRYYAGTDLGVYFSDNEGENWVYAGEGMPYVPVMDFDYVEIDDVRYLRAGTYGRGVYETTTLITDVRESKNLSKEQGIRAIPNPSTGKITIEYELIHASEVKITIHNQMGNIVHKQGITNQSRGKHTFTINGGDLPAGVYHCVLETRSGLQTTKLIKL